MMQKMDSKWRYSAAALCMMAPSSAMADGAPVHPWMDPALITRQHSASKDAARETVAKQRARLLIGAMTLDQKLQQLTGAKPEVLPELPECVGARHVSGIPSLNIPTFRITNGPVGLGQNDCVSAEILKAPLRPGAMGIMAAAYTHSSSAKATALPSALGAAASFDSAVADMYGRVIASEMRNLGLHVFEAPGVNLARLPILGRNMEYFGEDPFLSGTMAVAETKAVQSRGLIAMVKHFAANEQETNRQTIQENVDRQVLRELYLLPFEMAVKDGKAAAVMCAYNYVNGQSSCENRELLTDVLRKDWGFTGYVQSDFFAMKSTTASLMNGTDHEMPLPLHWSPDKMRAALDSGAVPLARINEALERRYTQAFKQGIFDRKLERKPIDFAAGGRLAREIGGRAAVLLQNNGALPLRKDLGHLVLIGKASQVYAQQAVTGGAVVGEPMGAGGGSSDVVPHYTVTPIAGLRAALAELGNTRAKVELILVDDANNSATIDGQAASFADAQAHAAAADAVVIMAGTISEEGADRATFTDNSGHQLAASAAVGSGLDWYAGRSNIIATAEGDNRAKDSHTVTMIEQLLATPAGGGRRVSDKAVLVLKDNAGVALPASLVGSGGPAIVEAWFPGQEDGNIVADVLFGRVNPSGKLPVTMPLAGKGFLDHITPAQFPGTMSGDGKLQTVSYSEQLAIGYRWYDANRDGACPTRNGANACLAFPFGHGLSYTTFATARPVLGKVAGGWRVTARVTNTGKREGAQVVQAYLSLPASANAVGAAQPPRRLVGFGRITLAPGRSGPVSITIDPQASHHPMSVWDEKAHRWVIPKGVFTLWVGTSSAPGDLKLAGTITR